MYKIADGFLYATGATIAYVVITRLIALVF